MHQKPLLKTLDLFPTLETSVKSTNPPPVIKIKPDLLSAGFPCQQVGDAQNASRKKDAPTGIDGAQSSLYWDVSRVITIFSPDYLILENVPALRIRGADRILPDLETKGYACWPFVVGAAFAGGQIKRDRTWIVAIQSAIAARLQGDVLRKMEESFHWRQDTYASRSDWGHATSRICVPSDGVPSRVGQLKGYGNAIVPQVAYPFVSFFQQLKQIQSL